MVFKSFLFPEVYVPWSWLWRQHRPLIVSVKLSRFWVVTLRIPYHLCNCNGLQTALIWTRWNIQSGEICRSVSTARESVTSTTSLSDTWRSGLDLITRSLCCRLQLLSGELLGVRGQDIVNTFYDNWQWSHCFIGENWTCFPCCHWNFCDV